MHRRDVEPAESTAGYRKSWLDRHGVEGLHVIRAAAWALPFSLVIGAVVFSRSAGRGMIIASLLGLGAAAIMFIGITGVSVSMANSAGKAFGQFIWPSGDSTPYQHDFSYEKALVLQGRVQDALESYEEMIRAHPEKPHAYLAAAETYAAHANPARAVELFRKARQLDALTDSQRIYATNRLIDLYLGAAQDAERARSELRYLLAHFPGTRTADAARSALERLTSEKSEGPAPQ